MVGAKPGLNRKRESDMSEKKLYTVTVIVEADVEADDAPETAEDIEDICEWVEMLLVGDPDAKDQLSVIRRSRYWYIKLFSIGMCLYNILNESFNTDSIKMLALPVIAMFQADSKEPGTSTPVFQTQPMRYSKRESQCWSQVQNPGLEYTLPYAVLRLKRAPS